MSALDQLTAEQEADVKKMSSDDGREWPVAFASCKLTASQQALAAIEAEAYAAIWSLRRYRNLIFGSKITCYCDHNPLLYNIHNGRRHKQC